MKRLTSFLLSACIVLFAFQTKDEPDGKKLYEINCLGCHGANGKKGFLGTGKLAQSKLDDATILLIIQNGKRIMPSYKKTFTEIEVKSLVVYIKSLRKTKS